jgi:SAM-dependent methyltransferase
MPLEWKAPPGLFDNPADVKGVFEKIYGTGLWGGGSGRGSDPEVVQPYLLFLQAFLEQNAIESVVDVGCGDWSFSQLVDWGNRRYLGVDVVASVIEENRREHGTANLSFRCADPTREDLQVSGDLLLMKDVLQHLSNANVHKLLALTRRFRFSLITNAYAPVNDDCENGDTRPLDLRAAPFNLHDATIVLAYAEKAVFLVPGA